MSVRAYRVIKKELADDSSFNLWHDTDLLDFFNKNSDYDLLHGQTESGGEMEISVDLLEKALKEFKWEKDDYRPDAIKADIKWAKKNDREYVNYECF